MRVKSDKNLEKFITEALELQEKGKTVPEILDLFPKHRRELEEIFEAQGIIAGGKENIVPPKELLTKIISIIPFEADRRPFLFRLFGRMNPFSINRTVYAGIGVFLFSAIFLGAYWRFQAATAEVSPVEKEIASSEESFGKDIVDLASLNDDLLDGIDRDLDDVVGKEGLLDDVPVEILESELASELDSFSNDTADLEEFSDENLLDNFDGEATEAIEL